jgi:hypothetical protein
MLLAVLLCGALLTACSADERDQIQAKLERAAQATKDVGQRITMSGSISVDGQSQTLRSRAAIQAGARRAHVSTQIGAMTFDQFLDGTTMLMSVDSLSTSGPWPAGTRYLKFDLDKLGAAAGLDTTLRDLQSLDPAKAASLLGDAAEDVTLRRGKVRGVAVERYSARVRIDKLARSLAGGKAGALGDALEDAVMTVEVAIDGDDRIRGFAMGGTIGPMTMRMRGEVTAFDRDLRVALPSTGIYDVTDAIAGLAGSLTTPSGP